MVIGLIIGQPLIILQELEQLLIQILIPAEVLLLEVVQTKLKLEVLVIVCCQKRHQMVVMENESILLQQMVLVLKL
jgi:hypothetical protein